MQHVRLNFKDIYANINMIKQNTLNRKANSYANPSTVEHLYSDYRKLKHDLDEARKKRNEHNHTVKMIVMMEDDLKRESLMSDHHKVAKSMKKDVQRREKEIDELETQLVREALKLPNKTHPDTPIGGDSKNKEVRQY